MDGENLLLNTDYISYSGRTLSIEQKTSLQISLILIKHQYDFKRIYFWGKIIGIREDYFILKGCSEDEMRNVKFLYSKNCLNWFLCPYVTKDMQERTRLTKGRFSGDPSQRLHNVVRRMINGDFVELTVELSEEERLAATIVNIEYDVCIAPRGAYIERSSGSIIKNRAFEGLSPADAIKTSNYYHLRERKAPLRKINGNIADFNPSIDFLDSLEEDVPRGCFTLHVEHGDALVIIRNLYWIGFTFFHIPNTRKYSYVYIGFGLLRQDVPFMID